MKKCHFTIGKSRSRYEFGADNTFYQADVEGKNSRNPGYTDDLDYYVGKSGTLCICRSSQ